ncbi:hypothetical protein AL486_05855 [Pandoraea apista]|nr:hypothetical protein AL486_05855 [Pandoraea apista]
MRRYVAPDNGALTRPRDRPPRAPPGALNARVDITHATSETCSLHRSVMRATRCITPRSFADGLSALHAVTDFDALRSLLPSLCTSLRQRYFSYRGHFPLPGGKLATPQLGNLPDAWQKRYDAQHYATIDPVLSRARRQLTPVEWIPALYASPEARQLLRDQRAAGLRSGITYPVFAPSGASGTLSLSSPRNPPRDPRTPGAHTWIQHGGAVLAMHVHEAVWRIVQRDTVRQDAPMLTPRERECLRWVVRGKTSWEIGRILTISEHGVVFHLRSAMRKFDVSSRHRAAKLASDYGLLDDFASTGPHGVTSAQQGQRASCNAST